VKTIFAFTFALLSLCLCASAQSRLVHPAQGITFQQLAEVTGSQAGNEFGLSVAVSGNTVIVGAPLALNACANCGAAYVYTATNGDWTNLTLVATLTPPPGQGTLGGFGAPVAISGDTIVVGNSGPAGSVAYVYVNPSGNATPTGELTTSVSGGGGGVNSIGIDGGTIVLGMPFALGVPHGEGAAFVYVEPPTGWANMTQTAELLSKDENTFFGWSAAISGRAIVVGATEVKVGGVEQGAAYLFLEPAAGWGGTWAPTTEFEASNGTRKAEFGYSVSVSGETVAVGAPQETVGSSQNKGAVYMFTRPSTGWPKTMTEATELTAGTGGSELGLSVALSGKTLVAGAPFQRMGQGFVYAFSEPSGGWQNGAQAKQIAASDGAANDYFGYSVAIGSGVIAAGAWEPSAGDGAAYVFGTNSQ
jgi:FG-GAP repeat protein